ncbi:MAG TPA: nucleoside-diphosphate kinase [Candidatus Competibacter sp.]|nr:nucleoside-diphosphate kinase [Candidatus Competibacteraceae bacterium]HUM94873.1 nucleoside-diphosphate kinase [Candidatus Competibacter sp.]
MAVERTLSIIKPGAVRRNIIGRIISRFESSGLRIAAARMLQLNEDQAQQFYAVHRERPFYSQLVAYMTEGPILVMVLEGEDAIARNRAIMGSTDPQKATPGTIRFDLGKDTTRNTVHGSDAPETAEVEIAFFFKPDDVCPRHE